MDDHRPFSAAIRFNYRPPALLFPLQALSYTGALVGLWYCALFIELKIWLTVLLLLHGAYVFYRWIRCNAVHNPVTVLLSKANHWSVRQGAYLYEGLQLENDVLVHPRLTILRLRGKQGIRFTFVLTVNNLPADVFRRLRVRLRHSQTD